MSDFFRQHEQQLQQIAQSLNQVITEYGNQMSLETNQKLMGMRTDIQNCLQTLRNTLNQELQGTKNAMEEHIRTNLMIFQAQINFLLKEEIKNLDQSTSQAITTAFGEAQRTSQVIQETLGLMNWNKNSLTHMLATQEENQAKIEALNKSTVLITYKILAWGLGVIIPLLFGVVLWFWTANLAEQKTTLTKEKESLESEVTAMMSKLRQQHDYATVQAMTATQYTIYTPKNGTSEPRSISHRYRQKPMRAEIEPNGMVTITFQ